MKTLRFLSLSGALTLASILPATAFDLGGIADKAASAVSGGGGGGLDMMGMGKDLLSSFQGNPDALNSAKGLLGSFRAEDYLSGFDYYDKIRNAGLTPAQKATWNDIKNPLSAMVLERKFGFEDSGLSDLVTKATTSLKENDVESAGNYLGQLKEAASLTPDQSALLEEIQANLPLVK